MADTNVPEAADTPFRNTPFQQQTGVDEQGRRIVAVYDEHGNMLAEGPVETATIFKIADPIEYDIDLTKDTP